MARQARREKKRTRNGYVYIDGNTVRELEPFVIPEQVDRERRRKAARAEEVRRNRNRQMVIDAGYMLFLTFAVIATLLACMYFLHLKAQVQSATSRVTAAKEEVMDLKAKNDAAYNKIMTSINLEEIRRVATEEYGMVPAGKDQIVRFKSNQDDYMTGLKAVKK